MLTQNPYIPGKRSGVQAFILKLTMNAHEYTDPLDSQLSLYSGISVPVSKKHLDLPKFTQKQELEISR